MQIEIKPSVVVIDYGLGNIFSIERAIKYVGAKVEITQSRESILNAERLILPGVGSFGDGMRGLTERGLIEPIKEYIKAGKPILGICLGMQLFMSEGEEFGLHRGLDVIGGRAVRLKSSHKSDTFYKIPHIGWNRLFYPDNRKQNQSENNSRKDIWADTILEKLHEGVFMYFVHSNVVLPDDPSYIIAETGYADNVFCSVIRKRNIYGCQFHPERSGEDGLEIYRKFIFEDANVR